MKNIVVSGKKVADVSGLYFDLIKNDFHVENVGVDQTGTHVFLADWEQKDPTQLVETWVGKPAPSLTRSAVEQRKTTQAEYQVKRAQKDSEERTRMAQEMGENPVSIATPIPMLPGSKQTLFSKIFRKLW